MATTKKIRVEVQRTPGRFRVRINGVTHLSFPYQEDDAKMVVHSYFIGKYFCNIDYHMPDGRVIETGYTRDDVFHAVLAELERNNII